VKRIVRNSAKCLKCGVELESKSVHDFVECACGNYVDGGREYIRRGGVLAELEETSIFEA
jgi:hypothetical protein